MENIVFWGKAYLTPWTPDDDRYKKHWWHNTIFANGPVNGYNYRYFVSDKRYRTSQYKVLIKAK